MALEATHIKFALDLHERFAVRDINAYIAGTIYPDSRYVSGIARTETHGDFVLSTDFLTSDFKKGWMVHFVCDCAGNRAMDEIFPDLSNGLTERGAGTLWWIRATALKILLDIEVSQHVALQRYFPITYAENPKGESIDAIKRYNALVTKMYAGKQLITIADAKQMWLDFGLDESLVNRVESCAYTYNQDRDILGKDEIHR